MRDRLFAALLFAGVSLVSLGQTAATLTIDTAKPIGKVSPTLYGIMTEEINYSYDGGLYAELVSNRTFQTNRGLNLEHWTLIQNGNSQANIAIDKTTGPSAAIPHSLFDRQICRCQGGSGFLQQRLLGYGAPAIDDISRVFLREGG